MRDVELLRPKYSSSPIAAASLMFAALGASANLSAAPPKCDSLFPSGGQRGQEVAVVAAGNFSNWPAAAWVDRTGLHVEPETDKGKFKIKVDDDATGVYWIRFHDKEGATQLRPFVVDSLPEVSETEPNNELSDAQKLDGSAIVNGRLEKSGDLDAYTIDMKAGQTLVASLVANQTLGSPMDAVLQVCSVGGFVLEQNDDERGVDPQIAFVAPSDGSYVVRTFAFPLTPNSTIGFAGASTYIYRLTLTTDGFVDHAFPLSAEPNVSSDVLLFGWNVPTSTVLPQTSLADTDRLFASHPEFCSYVERSLAGYPAVVANAELSRTNPQAIELPAIVTGRIDREKDEDVFRVKATKGSKIAIQVESDSLGYLLDPLVLVLDADGKVIGEVDDTNRKRDCLLVQNIAADGDYRIVVRDVHRQGGFRYVYRMTIDTAPPDFALTLAKDSYVLTPGKPLEVPVSIERKNGFSGEIEVKALDLPEGVTAEVVKSAAKGDSSKSVKIVLNGKPGSNSATFTVSGIATGDDAMERTATYAIAGTTAKNSAAWITVAASADGK